MNSSKIKSIYQITKIIRRLKKNRRKIVFTNGCFDILHIGHIKLLQEAKSFGDVLIIGLNSDYSVRKIKGKNRPIIPENERAEILSSFYMVDFVVRFSTPTPYELIKRIKPDILIKGADWENGAIVGSEFSKQVKRIPLARGQSTTKIIKKIISHR